MPEQLFHVVEMEQRLSQDQTGRVRDDILNQLTQHALVITQSIQQGLNPQDFEALKQLQEAIQQAMITVESYWLAKHQR